MIVDMINDMKIPLRNRRKEIVGYAIIDGENINKVSEHKWCLDKHGYAVSAWREKGKTINKKLHHFVLNVKNIEIDHINRDKLDNRKANLRIVTRSQNNMNSNKPRRANPYRGVHWDKSKNKWMAQIKFDGQHIFIGRFIDPLEAHNIYKQFAEQLFGEFYAYN